ncbi:homer protein homolog 3b isoform X1 [Siniperca chuatsi]|uniref:homer protein homolog 3b isoform X1 n=1 Tax=Siniperca chuatsi TaxID=119488 RepID=UPI001CE1621A|nr:homer protein homolog 3b isoform X1 [Siniperca chuatsi]
MTLKRLHGPTETVEWDPSVIWHRGGRGAQHKSWKRNVTCRISGKKRIHFLNRREKDKKWSGEWNQTPNQHSHPRSMGEQPIFSARAHVFQIDPATKRNWLPASKHAVTVSFFYDASRTVYRIISVGGTKAIINSTITPNMTFTKTSQKFGQWADSRANTVYGLGFSTEQQLQQFAEQFKEVKEAARLAREKSQERFELANPALNIAAPELSQELSEERHSPPLLTVNGPGEEKLFRSKSAEVELTVEKERVKKMLSEGSMCEINLEAELFTLQDSNAKLVAALQEANGSVEHWKKQLAEYQEETDRLRDQVAELEAQLGHPAAGQTVREELSRSLEELEALLSAKDQEIHNLQSKKTDVGELEKEREEAMQRLQDVERRNTELEDRVQSAEKTLASSREERDQAEVEVRRIIEVLDNKICDLNDLRQSLAKLIDK